MNIGDFVEEYSQRDVFDALPERGERAGTNRVVVNIAQKDLLTNTDATLKRLSKDSRYLPDAGDHMVAPQTALYWLTMNIKNRSVSDARVLKLAEAMVNDQWTNTGDPITFCMNPDNKTYYIISGQARLWAGWVSNVTVEHTIRYTSDVKVAGNIDTGKSRSVADLLSSEKFEKSNILGGVAKFVMGYEGFSPPFGNRTKWNAIPKFGSNEVLDYLLDRPLIKTHVKESYPQLVQTRRLFGGGVMVSALNYLTYIKDFEKYKERTDDFTIFWEDVETGTGLQSGDPILKLRDSLLADMASAKRSDKLLFAALLIKAWNFRKTGRTPGRLTWNPARGESFPEIIS